MSKVEIEIPDDGWFHRECNIRPQDKQLCVIIPKDDMIPRIYHYRDGRFYEVLDVLILKNIGIETKSIEAEYGQAIADGFQYYGRCIFAYAGEKEDL